MPVGCYFSAYMSTSCCYENIDILCDVYKFTIKILIDLP